MSYVNFGRKNTREQALRSSNRDKIFFPTDDTCIIMGGKEYGANRVQYLTQDEYDELVESGQVNPEIEYNIYEDDY